jgi:hypothetical protein
MHNGKTQRTAIGMMAGVLVRDGRGNLVCSFVDPYTHMCLHFSLTSDMSKGRAGNLLFENGQEKNTGSDAPL